MKNQTNKRRQTVLPATIATIFLLGAFGSTFAQSVGAKYGTRDPRTCADTKAPASGAMTAALATKYVICSSEGIKSDYLYLLEDLPTVEVGGGVPYNPRTYPYATDVDTKALIYPFRTGSYKQYQCGAISEISENKGYNCNIYTYPKGTGVCMKSTFGDWSCTMGYQESSQTENNMPPPTGAKGGATDKANAAAKNGNQTAATKAGADDDGLPPPDFSEMGKYFDISKIEYSTADHKLYFIGKMTKKNNAIAWSITFYDADGIKVYSSKYNNAASGDYSEVGDIAKFYFYLPEESKWKFVKKVVITRLIS